MTGVQVGMRPRVWKGPDQPGDPGCWVLSVSGSEDVCCESWADAIALALTL